MLSTIRLVRSFGLPVRLLLVNQFGVNTGFYLLVPYLATHLSQNLGLSLTMVGLVLGVRTLSQQGLFLIGGSAADRLGARGVIIAGCGLRAVGFGLFALGESVTVLLAASVLSGLAGALFNPAVRAYIAVEAKDRRAEAFAAFGVFAQAGALVGPLLGSLLLLVDFRVAAITASVIFAALTVAQAMVLPARPVERTSTTVVGDWREVLGNRRFIWFTLALTGLFALQTQLYLVLPLQADRITHWAGAVAVMFAVSTVASVLWQVRLTTWAQRTLRPGRAIAIGMAAMGLAFLLPLAMPSGHPDGWVDTGLRLLPMLAAVLALEFGVMLAQPFVLDLIPGFGRDGLAGTYFGVFYLASGLVAAGGNALLGWAVGVGGNGWPALLLCVALGLGSAAAVTALDRRRLLDQPAAVAR